jgi:hypothetical protein
MPWSFNFGGLFNMDSWFSGNFISSLGSWNSNSLTSIMLDPRITPEWTLRSYAFNNSSRSLFNYGGMSIGDNYSFGQTAIWQPNTTTGTNNSTGAATTGSTTGKTPEEQKAERINLAKTKDKIKTLTEILTKFKESNTCTEPYELEDSLKYLPSKIDEKYEALQGIYNKYKTEIQTMLKKDMNLEASDTIKNTAKSLKTQIADASNTTYTSILTDDDPPKLKGDVDVIALLSQLQDGGNSSFILLYENATKTSGKNRRSLNDLFAAISEALVTKANKIKNSDGISEDTKAKISNYAELNDESVKKYSNEHNAKVMSKTNLESLYYWIRIAEAEIADSKYKLLSEDFPNEETFKAGANVKKAKADMAKEGMQHVKTE